MRPSSKELSKGDRVVAIGSPKDLSNTVSEGIISAFRLQEGVNVIQTTADVDNGSSGGGLFDESGQLVGVVFAAIESQSANLNFAVAIEEFIPMVNRYISKEFTAIDASFSTNSLTSTPDEFVFLDEIALGMTKEQVKSLSTGSLYKEVDKDTILYKDVGVYGLLALKLEYKFQNNKLVKILVTYNLGESSEDQKYVRSTFDEMIVEISKDTGGVLYMDENWSENAHGKSLKAYWVTTTYQVLFGVNDSLDDSDFAVVEISILD